MTIHLLWEREEGLEPVIVAAYLSEKKAQDAIAKLGDRPEHSLEEIALMDA